MNEDWPAVSVIMSVLNEERHLATAVRHALGQDYPGEIEVVIAVGPSTDQTRAVADRLAAADSRVVVVDNPTGRTPAGLNAAIAASQHPVVARVDGHALLPVDYLRLAVQALNEHQADNVGGIMAAEGESPFEQAVAAAMTSRIGVGNARFHTGGASGPADTVYLGVFRRSALERVDGYDEAFLRAQDWEMNHRIRTSGGTVWFEPRMRVSYRPRSTVSALARQYFHYGRWRRVVARQHAGTINLRYLAPPMAVLAIAVGTVVGFIFWPAWLIPLGYLAAIGVAAVPLGGQLPWQARLAIPVALGTMHLAWGVGFLTSPPSLGADSRTMRAGSAAGRGPTDR
ncbi:glycosyltransferase family 2 protein [Lipingzhangella sp. LS1_29]|uniref:Glycosyltransferase family 2 protein n=1 Tax=Lipingzhangella rawalii TaxID=2055835 RepID=A0ABU2H6F6_9ACTN|nr:glycosyltransferase family 2 protein [Lipingzhangella rawalii]MDS1270410.1 glycosyltransferase family 2 protein [Lipingzhangella rawalii]